MQLTKTCLALINLMKYMFIKKLATYFYTVFKINPAKPSILHDIFCVIATMTPLVFGLIFGDFIVAFYASIMSYLLAIFGRSTTFKFHLIYDIVFYTVSWASIIVASLLSDHLVLYYFIIFVWCFLYCMFNNEGAEIETSVMIGLILFIVAYAIPLKLNTPSISVRILGYTMLGFIIITLQTILHLLFAAKIETRLNPLQYFKQLWNNKSNKRYIYSITYSILVALLALFIKLINIQHGFWALIVFILLIQAEIKTGIYRTSRRVLGTLFAAIIVEFALSYFNLNKIDIFVLLALLSFFTPWSIKLNYWVFSFVITLFILLCLSLLITSHKLLLTLPWIRLETTVYGAVANLIGFGIVYSIFKFYQFKSKS